MSWKRIVKYVIGLIIAINVIVFFFSFFEGFISTFGSQVPAWWWLANNVVVFIAFSAIFARFGQEQFKQVYRHGLAVVFGYSLSSLVLDVILFGQPLALWGAGVRLTLFAFLVGVWIAMRRRGTSYEPEQVVAPGIPEPPAEA